MAKTFINRGEAIRITLARALVNSAVVVEGKLIGIADRNSLANTENTIHTQGHFELPKIAGALAIGADYKVDITDLNAIVHSLGALSSTVVSVGVVTRAVASGDLTVDVLLNK
ncbi:MAG: DUF2190 family protein [Chloroflexi bacterium]|nr:DUF2190 family protein [Chloroflexota bacterium]